MIFIVAGNYQQAQECARKYRLRRGNYRPVSNVEQLRGYFKQRAWYFGNYRERRDLEQIETYLHHAEFSFERKA